jgi:hypothetical protein
MLAVGIVAANLAPLRAAGTDLTLVCGPAVLLLEVAAWRAWRDRGPGRAFWAGYAVLGGLVTVAIGWWVAFPPLYGRLPDGTFGVVRAAPPGAGIWEASYGLGIDAAGGAWRWAFGSRGMAAEIVGAFLGVWGPQVAAGVVGGWIGRGLASGRVAPPSGAES